MSNSFPISLSYFRYPTDSKCHHRVKNTPERCTGELSKGLNLYFSSHRRFVKAKYQSKTQTPFLFSYPEETQAN